METKKCTKCGNKKTLNCYYPQNSTKDGLTFYCKLCANEISKNNRKTKDGLISRIYSDQKNVSQKRNLIHPAYTKEELREWMFNQELFHKLYNNWKMSGYKKMLSPSCDRTDDYKGYSLKRLQLMTWGENFKKACNDRKNGINNKLNKAVVGINKATGLTVIYHSINEAERKTGTQHSRISACCKGIRKSAGGYVWSHKRHHYTFLKLQL